MNLKAAPARLSTASATFEAEFKARLHWSAEADAAIEQVVADILADVQRRGDEAVLAYTRRFDRLDVDSLQALELTAAELRAAFETLPVEQKNALEAAARRVRSYHEAQKKARASAGAIATPTAPCSARRSRRWTGSASTCRAARPPIPPACS